MVLGTLWVALALAAPPPDEGALKASVLIAEAVALDAARFAEAYAQIASDEPAPEVTAQSAGRLKVASARFGEAELRVENGRLAGADEAFRRGLSALISDAEAPAHTGRVVIALRPKQGLPMSAAAHALARLAVAGSRAWQGVGIHFAEAGVLHPASFGYKVIKDRLPLSWLWVGIALGGTKDEPRLMSRGLAATGLRELVLEVKRREVGYAIESFFELVALVLTRGSDFPDGHEIERKDAPAFVVRHGDESGIGVWRIAFSAPPPK